MMSQSTLSIPGWHYYWDHQVQERPHCSKHLLTSSMTTWRFEFSNLVAILKGLINFNLPFGSMNLEIWQISGKITYCGHELDEFVPQRTSAYISQHDLHHGEMTVRETLDFSGRCLGVGTRYEMLAELSRREMEAGIKPDPEIDAFMKATALAGQETSLVTDYVIKVCLFF